MDSNSYNMQYKKLVEMLEESLTNKKHGAEILWITYRILDEESRRKILEYIFIKKLKKDSNIKKIKI